MSAVLSSLPASRPPVTSSFRDVGGFFAHHGIWAPGVRIFRQMRFMTKARLISLVLIVPLLSEVVWNLHANTQEAMKARMDATQRHVQIAHQAIAWAYGEEKAGHLTREQAQETARQLVSTMRFGDGEYFWINDMQPRIVMHPTKPELNGKDATAIKDPNGLALFVTFVETVRAKGEGFVSYQWPKPGSDKPVDKVSYVKGFEPWGWIVGSGIYVGDLHEAANQRYAFAAIIIAGTLGLGAYLFVSFYRVMSGGLKETRRHMRAMTSGDLTTSPAPWGKDEAAELMHELRDLQEWLRGIVARVRVSSDEILHTSTEIASGAMDLSGRTEQAAANLEETAASMEEISATVKSTADTTTETAQVAHHNAEVAADGGRIMREVVTTMEGIRTSSARIGEIIGTIDGIAFQTNILALNAAVEAARAGEQGRGFAVVASEVRMLAQRSAEAAREIKTLISNSVAQTEQGTEVVLNAGKTIDDIVASSQKVNELLANIATGAREQSAGVSQVGQSVQDMDRMTQQNAALVEQTAAATTALKEQAQILAEEVRHIRLPAGVTASGGAPALAPVTANFNFDNAIDAHRQWKVRLRKAISQRAQLDADTICQDDRCPLGQWLHGAGRTQFAGRPNFVELVERHADFHRVAGDVARTINAGRYDDAEALIGSGSRFAQVSGDVGTLLSRAKRGL